MPQPDKLRCEGVEISSIHVALHVKSCAATGRCPGCDSRRFSRPSDRLTLISGVENFTNKQYQEHLDYSVRNPLALSTFRAGATFYCGAELNYWRI